MTLAGLLSPRPLAELQLPLLEGGRSRVPRPRPGEEDGLLGAGSPEAGSTPLLSRSALPLGSSLTSGDRSPRLNWGHEAPLARPIHRSETQRMGVPQKTLYRKL